MKTKNLLFFTFACLIVLNTSVFAQKGVNRIDKDFLTPVSFPYDYLGAYSGNLRVSNNTGVLENYPTDFSIVKTDDENVFEYTLSYISEKRRVTSLYKLHIIDESNGFYAIKDNNGLEFTGILVDNILHSTFELGNTITFTTLQFTNDQKVRLTIYVSNKVKPKNKDKKAAKFANVALIQRGLFSKLYN